MLHRKADVVLSVCESGNLCYYSFRHNLCDKGHSSSVFARFLAANVESQIHLIKISMKRDRSEAEKSCAEEPKADQANVCSALKEVQDGASRNIVVQQTGINIVIEHH